MDNLELAKEFFKGDIYATDTTGIEIVEVGQSYAKCCLKIDKKHFNANNSVMGGAIFTMADFTFAVASNINQLVSGNKANCVALNSQISFLSVAKGDTLISEAKAVKIGRSTAVFQVEIMDNLGNLVSIVTTTGFIKH